MTSAFDPNSFLDATLEEPSERRSPLPVGDYVATIEEVTARTWQGKKDPTKSGIAWDVQLAVEVPADVQTLLGLTKSTLTLKDSIMLDLTPNNTIDNAPGKNPRLRNYREALDMNKPGDVFSARKMIGRLITVKVAHDLYEGMPIEKISGVART